MVHLTINLEGFFYDKDIQTWNPFSKTRMNSIA